MIGTDNFLNAYKSLNDKQKQAVDTIYGPLMVIAGPGTGKTQLLSTRVGHILRETDFRPYNILCLTYTTSGVAAMKQRLVDLIGPNGHDVEVYTFHSFAEKIIQRYARYNAMDTFQFIDEIDKRILIRELLEDVEFNTPLKKGVSSVDNSIYFIQNVISQMKREKYDSDLLIDALEREKVTRKGSDEFLYKRKTGAFNKGDLNPSKWKDFENKLDKNIQALHLYKKYTEVITERKLMDFDDMLLKSLNLLERELDLRLDIQEQYQVILVDEFQDTNGAQLDLIHQLCLDNDEPNVMVVGDEDQSIYRFQGANLFNIHDFYRRYLAHKPIEEQLNRIIVLEENYRSTPVILDVSKVLIEHNTERITNIVEGKSIIKRLVAAHPDLKERTESVELIEVENMEDEMLPIALKIEELVKSGVDLRGIAVLFPVNGQMVNFAKYLDVLGYPYELSREENILEDSLIKSYLQVFHFVQDFAQRKILSPEHFSEMLLHPWLNISLYDISKFWVEVKASNFQGLFDFLEYLENYRGIENIEKTIAIFKTCVQNLTILPPHRFFHFVLDSFQIKEWAMTQPQRMDIFQKIDVLEGFLRDYLNTLDNPKMSDILARIDAYIRENVSIPYIKRFYSDDSIKLTTYHKSKGLEFDYVFVFNAGRYANKSNENLYVPEDILSKNLSDEKEQVRVEEEKRRLLYVAMTRAKQKLFLTDRIVDEKNKSKNKFKQELNPISEADLQYSSDISAPIVSNVYHLTQDDYLRFETLNELKFKIKEERFYENNFILQRLQNLKLSHSSMNTYLECPQKFFMEKIISIPSETTFQMSLGNFYHGLLESFDKMILLRPEKKKLAELLTLARQSIQNFRGWMTEHEYRDVQLAMETNIPILYHQYLYHQEIVDCELEKELEMSIGNCMFTGKLDKIIFEGDKVVIFDYKTGKFSNSKKNHKFEPFRDGQFISEDASTDQRYGGNYWRQAVIYAMLLKANYPNKKLDEIRFVYILPEDHDIHVHSINPTMEDEQYMRNLILMTYRNIQNKEFAMCRQMDCSWCAKVSHRQHYV